jgi:hypothetical protein
MHADSLAGGSLVGGSLARKTEKGTKRTLNYRASCACGCGDVWRGVVNRDTMAMDDEEGRAHGRRVSDR